MARSRVVPVAPGVELRIWHRGTVAVVELRRDGEVVSRTELDTWRDPGKGPEPVAWFRAPFTA